MAYNEALKRAQKKYDLTHDRIMLRCPPGTIQAIEELGFKRQEFIRDAIKEKIEREKEKRG